MTQTPKFEFPTEVSDFITNIKKMADDFVAEVVPEESPEKEDSPKGRTTTFAGEAVRVLQKAEGLMENSSSYRGTDLFGIADRYIRLAEIEATHNMPLL